jgi:pyrroloquinoline quinone (PQQ) biosynthesis protein C
MLFYDRLQNETETARQNLMATPLITNTLQGKITLEIYLAFLTQAYHHVKHTTPLLMTVGGKIPHSLEWLREAVAEYIEEEVGHQEWILNDIEACGGDREAVRQGTPSPETEVMVAYAYDMIQRVNPLGFFGMVQVLEGTSIQVATESADKIQQTLALPSQAFSYLRSHGSLDQEHIKFFASLMNRIETPEDQKMIIHTARMFYKLYGDIFRALPVYSQSL